MNGRLPLPGKPTCVGRRVLVGGSRLIQVHKQTTAEYPDPGCGSRSEVGQTSRLSSIESLASWNVREVEGMPRDPL